MAADEDEDALEKEHKMQRLSELARAIHIYHSRTDGALVISDVTKFNPDRLGHNGPRTFSGLNNRIVAIDCTECDATEKLTHVNHQYYRLRPEVIADVRAVLAGRLPDQIPARKVVESGRRYRLPAQP
jgi:esterase/lipase superfamily enzyme